MLMTVDATNDALFSSSSITEDHQLHSHDGEAEYEMSPTMKRDLEVWNELWSSLSSDKSSSNPSSPVSPSALRHRASPTRSPTAHSEGFFSAHSSGTTSLDSSFLLTTPPRPTSRTTIHHLSVSSSFANLNGSDYITDSNEKSDSNKHHRRRITSELVDETSLAIVALEQKASTTSSPVRSSSSQHLLLFAAPNQNDHDDGILSMADTNSTQSSSKHHTSSLIKIGGTANLLSSWMASSSSSQGTSDPQPPLAGADNSATSAFMPQPPTPPPPERKCPAINPYHVLQIRRDATLEEVRQAYRRLALWHHPGRKRTRATREAFPPPEDESDAMFEAVAASYETLLDRDARQRFDFLWMQQQQEEEPGGRHHHRVATTTPSSQNMTSSIMTRFLNEVLLLGSIDEGDTFMRQRQWDEAKHQHQNKQNYATSAYHHLICSGEDHTSIPSLSAASSTSSCSNSSAPPVIMLSPEEVERLCQGPLRMIFTARNYKPFTEPMALFTQVFGSSLFSTPPPPPSKISAEAAAAGQQDQDDVVVGHESKAHGAVPVTSRALVLVDDHQEDSAEERGGSRNSLQMIAATSAASTALHAPQPTPQWTSDFQELKDGTKITTTSRTTNGRRITRTETVKTNPETGLKETHVTVTTMDISEVQDEWPEEANGGCGACNAITCYSSTKQCGSTNSSSTNNNREEPPNPPLLTSPSYKSDRELVTDDKEDRISNSQQLERAPPAPPAPSSFFGCFLNSLADVTEEAADDTVVETSPPALEIKESYSSDFSAGSVDRVLDEVLLCQYPRASTSLVDKVWDEFLLCQCGPLL